MGAVSQSFLIMGVGADLGRNAEGPRRFHAQVVLIDKTHLEAGLPPAYELKEFERRYVSADSFAMMGGVASIDKTGKQIFLANGDVLSYDHLIVTSASGHTYVSHDGAENFQSAMDTLAQAIKLRRRVQADMWTPRPAAPYRSGNIVPRESLSAVAALPENSDGLLLLVKAWLSDISSDRWLGGVQSDSRQVVFEVQV